MGDNTGIEWTDATWNPIVGCSVVSPGCTNCYAMRQADRIGRMAKGRGAAPASPYVGTTAVVNGRPVWTGKVALAAEATLTAPLRWARPRRIFVNSMGDLFHEAVPDAWIDRVFGVMALAPRHRFQVLTKRAGRMRGYVAALAADARANRRSGGKGRLEAAVEELGRALGLDHDLMRTRAYEATLDGPLPNVWLGVSAEDQARADARIPELLATPAAVRFVSCEPLLGPIDIGPYLHDSDCSLFDEARVCTCGEPREVALDWVIAGGESGPGARPMLAAWARSLRDQCEAARGAGRQNGVPFFFKQWGEWVDADAWLAAVERSGARPLVGGAAWRPARPLNFGDAATLARLTGGRRCEHQSDGTTLIRVGKRAAGRHLDGAVHDGMPEAGR